MAEADYDAIAARIEACLEDFLPEGFRVVPLDRGRGWAIECPRDPSPEPQPPSGEYGIWVTADCEWVMASYGNTDAGYEPSPVLQTLSLPAALVNVHPTRDRDLLGAMIRQLVTLRPNYWACT